MVIKEIMMPITSHFLARCKIERFVDIREGTANEIEGQMMRLSERSH
jgi:hypothetical protein